MHLTLETRNLKDIVGAGNVLILSDIDQLDWTKDLLTDAEAELIRHIAQSDICRTTLPRINGFIIIQFLKPAEQDDTYRQRELARRDGSDLGAAANRMIQEVNSRGGPDNVSVILIRTGKEFERRI